MSIFLDIDLRAKYVSYTGFGHNIARLRGLHLHFSPQLANIDPQVIGLVPIFRPPNRAQEIAVSQDLASMQHQMQKQLKFGGGKLDILPAGPHLAPDDIHCKVLIFTHQHIWLLSQAFDIYYSRRASKAGAHTSLKFLITKRLG